MFPFAHRFGFVAVMAAMGGFSCARFQTKPVALYPGPVRTEDQVVLLNGSIEKVDGVDVTRKGTTFALLPGCHVAELKRTYGEGTPEGSWSATIPRTVYALRTRAGYDYEIDIRRVAGSGGLGMVSVVGNSGASGSLKVTVTERDKKRAVIATLSPIANEAEIAACKAWEQETNGPSSSAGGGPESGAVGGGEN